MDVADKTLTWVDGTDPVSQASLWVPYTLYPWQARVLDDLTRPGTRVAVVTPNESGKTSTVIPAAGLAFMAAFPGAQVASTSGVERQIREQLWPVLTAAVAKYPDWKVSNDDLKITAPSVEGMPPSTWKAFTARDAKDAEGFHGRWYRNNKGLLTWAPLMLIVDEAKTFEDDMFSAFKRCDPDAWLTVSTPGEDAGPFFECFNLRRGKPWSCHEITWDDCPHLRVGVKLQDRLEEIEAKGMNNPIVLSWIFGKFFRSGGRVVFENMRHVERAMSGMGKWSRGHRRAALDFSAGGDEAVFAVRDGNRQMELAAFHERDTTFLGDKFLALLRKWEVKPEDTVGDNGGLGKPIIDYMERRGFRGIVRYMSDDEARDKSLYVNRVAEDHFYLKELLASGSISLVDDAKLKDQIRRRQYVMKNDDSNRIRMEPKEKMRDRGEGSPDRLDATVMLFSDMPAPVYNDEPRYGKCGDPNACCAPRENEAESTIWGRSYFSE